MSFHKKLEAMALNFFVQEGKEPNKPLNTTKSEKLIIKASEVALTLLAVSTFKPKDRPKQRS